MRNTLTTWLPLVVLGMLGVLAALGRHIELTGDSAAEGAVPPFITVTSKADRGPGSLRSALFLAMRADGPVTIGLSVPVIELDVPLPPVAVPDRLRIEGQLAERTQIVNLQPGNENQQLLQLVSDNIELAHLAVDANGAVGIAVRGADVVLEGIESNRAAYGVLARDVTRLTVFNSRFSGNGDGVRVEGRSGSVILRRNEFLDNGNSNAWVVFSGVRSQAPHTVVIHDNQFSGARNSIVVANAVADLRGNRVHGFANAGFMIIDANATVAENRIIDSQGIGLHLSGLHDSFVTNNEIGRNSQVGVLIVDANGLQVDSNKIYANGYGIAAVGRKPINASLRNNMLVDQSIDGLIAIGNTPLIDSNRALRNRRAGIRIMDLDMPDSPLITSDPRLTNNVLNGNGDDEVLFGRYVVRDQ